MILSQILCCEYQTHGQDAQTSQGQSVLSTSVLVIYGTICIRYLKKISKSILHSPRPYKRHNIHPTLKKRHNFYPTLKNERSVQISASDQIRFNTHSHRQKNNTKSSPLEVLLNCLAVLKGKKKFVKYFVSTHSCF